MNDRFKYRHKEPRQTIKIAADDPALDRLPEHQRAPLRLVHGGTGYQAAADQLGIPLNTLKTRVHRGRVALKLLKEGTP